MNDVGTDNQSHLDLYCLHMCQINKLIKILLSVQLTHLYLASRKRDIGKQSIPLSDAAFCGVWSGSTLFALSWKIPTKMVIIKTNHRK